jgi:hypothetical protein
VKTRLRPLGQLEESRLAVGLILQPVVTALVAFTTFPFMLLNRDGRTLDGGWPADVTDAALAVVMGVAIMATALTVVLVWPTALYLMKRRTLTFGDTLLWGVAFGNLPFVVLALAAGGVRDGFDGIVRGVLFSSLLGVAGAAVFWAVVLRPGVSDAAPRGS